MGLGLLKGEHLGVVYIIVGGKLLNARAEPAHRFLELVME
jgi:hypothetical protein